MTMTMDRPAVRVLTAIRCTGRRKSGELCNEVLCKVDVDHWEELLSAAPHRQDKCKCGKVYSLAEYLQVR